MLSKNFKKISCSVVSKLKNFDPEGNLLIFSEPRGGSTWMAETISQLPRTPVLWEPLHLRGVDHFKKAGLGWEQIIPEDADWPEAEKAFDELFRGKVLNDWLCSSSPPRDFLFAERMLIKFCRANAMLPWLTRKFKFKYKPLYLIRHPLAVVSSQLKHGAWDSLPDGFKIPKNKYNGIYLRNADFLSSLRSKPESLLANWCIMNVDTIKNSRSNVDWITVFYEDLMLDSKKELSRIFSQWRLDLPLKVIERLPGASKTTKEATFLHNKTEQLEKWMYQFSSSQLDSFKEILDHFGVDCYDVKSAVRVN